VSILEQQDPEIWVAIRDEGCRHELDLELSVSARVVSKTVLDPMGFTFANEYAEGYPGRRYAG
jgi:glycine hydroxymethyltransferase